MYVISLGVHPGRSTHPGVLSVSALPAGFTSHTISAHFFGRKHASLHADLWLRPSCRNSACHELLMVHQTCSRWSSRPCRMFHYLEKETAEMVHRSKKYIADLFLLVGCTPLWVISCSTSQKADTLWEKERESSLLRTVFTTHDTHDSYRWDSASAPAVWNTSRITISRTKHAKNTWKIRELYSHLHNDCLCFFHWTNLKFKIPEEPKCTGSRSVLSAISGSKKDSHYAIW